MGNCIHCNEQITLSGDERGCPRCGMNPYNCWNCKTHIFGDEKECPVCHFFKCSQCGICGKDCILSDLLIESKGMSKRQIIEYVYLKKSGTIRKNCLHGIPISYAHGKLRNLVLKMLEETADGEMFEKRFEKILDFNEGREWVISNVKEDGHYGIEWREASNFCVCMGHAKKITRKNKYGHEYEVFVKINDGKRCEYSKLEELRTKYCRQCKNTFVFGMTYCPNCQYKIGPKKGEPKELVIRRSKIQFCSLPRTDFVVKEDVKDGKID